MSNVDIELETEIENQKRRYWRTQPVSGLVGCVPASVGNSATLYLAVKNDGDFMSEHLVISALGPVDANGVVPSSAPDTQTGFPSGRTSSALVDLASRGLAVKLTDLGSGRILTDGFISIELLATPGYGNFMREAMPFRYAFRKEAKLEIEIVNNDIAVLAGGADAFHAVSFALVGKKFLSVGG